MMKPEVKKLYDELQEDLAFYEELGAPPANRLSGALFSVRAMMIRLKVLVMTEGFGGPEAEIAFFKHEKPLFVAEQVYLTEYTVLLLGKPMPGSGLVEAYYIEELKRVQTFINRFGFLYQCYKMEAKDLDSVLFLRGAGPSGMLLPETPDADPQFSTNGDFLWAKFMAYERLQAWLEEQLALFHGQGKGTATPHGHADHLMPPIGLKWTGESINLVELAYGIWLTGQVNNGNVSITEIVEFLEAAFRVRIGKPHRRWQGIANRKRLGYTRFLDECKGAIAKRIEEELVK